MVLPVEELCVDVLPDLAGVAELVGFVKHCVEHLSPFGCFLDLLDMVGEGLALRHEPVDLLVERVELLCEGRLHFLVDRGLVLWNWGP